MRYRTSSIFPPLTGPLTHGEKIALFLCTYVSLCLIAHLWIRHRRDSFLRKLSWSFVLLIPVIGWVFFGAFYSPAGSVDPTDTPDGSE